MPNAAPSLPRIAAIDLARGLIMALMALDHARIFIFGFAPSPTDLAETTPALFATRWITHLCAPGFLLLAGMSVWLQAGRMPRAALARRLALRGALLVVLEVTVVTFAWIPDPGRSLILLQVIWAIGWSMIAMSVLVLLPVRAVGALGVALVALHPQIAALAGAAGLPGGLRAILLDANATPSALGSQWIVSYPILPWTGVMAAGYALGAWLFAGGWQGRAAWLGAGLLAVFVALRLAGLGDPMPWVAETGPMGFLNAGKYPPSPAYLAMTLGPMLLLLAGLDAVGRHPAARALQPLGQAALFFYILHLYALRALGLGLAAMVWGIGQLGPPPLHSSPEWPLWTVWAIWAVAMPVLFLPTRWFARLKRRRAGGWTSYF